MLLAEPGQRRGEQPARRGREGAQHQLADGLPAPRLQIRLGQLDLGQDARRVIGQEPPGIGQPHSPAVLGEQLLPCLTLQLGQLLGDGGGGHVQPVGRGADGTVASDGVERTQTVQVQHVSDATRRRPQNFDCSNPFRPPS